MTVTQAINECDAGKPNGYTPAEKTRWLSRLDGRIHGEILARHEGMTDREAAFRGYTEATDPATELLAEAPYDEMYPVYLQMQVDFYNGEYGRYNNVAATFEQMYAAFADHINRTRMPTGVRQVTGLA